MKKSVTELFYSKFRDCFLEQLDLGLIESVRISQKTVEIWFTSQEDGLVENYVQYHFKKGYALVVSVESQPEKPNETWNSTYKATQEYAYLQAIEFCEELLNHKNFEIEGAKFNLKHSQEEETTL